MSWTKKKVLAPLPEELEPIISTLTGTANSVQAILEPLSLALEAASTLFLIGNDLFAAIMNEVIGLIEDLVNDLFGAGLFQLIINPFTISNTTLRRARIDDGESDAFDVTFITPDQAIKLAIKSLDDPGDVDFLGNFKRPNFSESATVAGFGLLVTVKDINAYLRLLKLLFKVWATEDLDFAIKKAESLLTETPRSTGADWDSMRLNQITQLGLIHQQLLAVLALCKGYTLVPEGLINLINLIKKKLDDLIDIIDVFKAVVDDLANLEALAGVYVFDLPPTLGGNEAIKAALPNPELQGPEFFLHRYTFFMLYIGGGPGTTAGPVIAADNIRKIFASFDDDTT